MCKGQAWQPEFTPLDLQGWREERDLACCPLIFECMLVARVCVTHTQIKSYFKKQRNTSDL